MEFKAGDRVIDFGDEDSPLRSGTFVRQATLINDTIPSYCSWVKFDGSKHIGWANTGDLIFEKDLEEYNSNKLKEHIEECVDFLISQGYTVSKNKP